MLAGGEKTVPLFFQERPFGIAATINTEAERRGGEAMIRA